MTLHCFKETRPIPVKPNDNKESVQPMPGPSHINFDVQVGPSEQGHSANLQSKPTISSFISGETVSKAEILWVAHCVTNQLSMRTGSSAVELFPIMFPESTTAQKMRLHKDKIAYSATYGLGPYFLNEVCENVRKSPVFALSVDECLNEISQKNQMDIMVNYWDESVSRINTRYLNSLFLEKSTASNMLQELLTCVESSNLSLEKLVQLSTDGPNVNLKLIFDLRTHMREHLTSEQQILDVGTCSLHIINGAYKTGLTKVGWKLNQFLRAIYRMFKNYPSRRASYLEITGSSLYPKKFCAVRWTENSDVIKRCLEMLPFLRKYTTEIKKPPETEHFDFIKKILVEDKTLEAKLQFSRMIAEELEEFLVLFQRNDPLLPFLHQEVFTLVKNLGQRFIKKAIIDDVHTATKLKKIDVTCEDTLQSFETVDIGFGARSCLKSTKEIDKQRFRVDCKKMLIAIFSKIMEKSPLNKRIVLGASCLNPLVMTNSVLSSSRVKVAIEELISHSQISSSDGDVILREYKKLCENPVIRDKLSHFNWKKDRLDVLFADVFEAFQPDDVNKKLKLFIQQILVCFHGNAAVERSFSFNKMFLVENLQEKSLVAQRSIHDHIRTLPGK